MIKAHFMDVTTQLQIVFGKKMFCAEIDFVLNDYFSICFKLNTKLYLFHVMTLANPLTLPANPC